jgi:purine-binding chemotaxis protein CheW
MRIPADNIQPAPELVTSEGNAYIAGFAKLDERLLVLLDIDELLKPEKLDQVNQAALRGGHLPGE